VVVALRALIDGVDAESTVTIAYVVADAIERTGGAR
jgi:hypothetical protein